jgi:outer membrane protein TolC
VAVDQTTAMLALSSRENELFVQLNTLWNNYQTSLLTIDIERQNIETNKSNFELVKSLYENGQQSSIEFRQAQLNLLTARSQYYNSLVSAKLLEIEIDFLLGR